MLSQNDFNYLLSLLKVGNMKFLLTLIVFGLATVSFSKSVLEKREIFLDPESKYFLTWQVNLDTKIIEFEAVVETTGFIGFGISAVGKMDNADLFIAGVENDDWFSYDMHGVDHNPVADDKHDWNLVSAKENGTHTQINFWRLLNTCDDQDFPITSDTTRIIWSYGATDNISYHGANRGTKSFKFLAKEDEGWDPLKYQRFDITSEFSMPEDDTTYWCTLHRGPQLTGKNHIVSFEALLPSDDALKYTHHFILRICHAPPGMNATELFEPHVGGPGHACYVLPEDQPLPLEHCQEYVYVWAVGGKPSRFPENLGYPFGETESDIFYCLEVHYDNPRKDKDVVFDAGVTIYYTDELRDTDVGQMVTPYGRDPSLIVPPMTSDFVINTHCAPACTNLFPKDGIKIFNVLLHSHLAGRKITFRHFRNGKELPWILNDNNYDFNFQQNAPIEPLTILPGDHLTVECVFDSTDRNKSIVTGGLSSREEMCEAVFWYYPRIAVLECGSQYPFDVAIPEFGVTNYTLQEIGTRFTMPYIWAPEELAGPNGMDYVTMLNTKYNWTVEFIEQMKNLRRNGEHEYHCYVEGQEPIYGFTQYPEIEENYIPADPCPAQKGSAYSTIILQSHLLLAFCLCIYGLFLFP